MKNRRIAIADDDVQLLDYYKCLFAPENVVGFQVGEKQPYIVDTFPDGSELVEFFKKEFEMGKRIPLCMLDMRMTKMGGLETAEAVRAIDPEVIIVIITAHSDITPEELFQSLQNNVYYLKKPVRSEELLSQITSLLNNWNHFQALKEAYRKVDRIRRETQSLLNHSPTITTQQDLEGRYRMVNRKFEHVFGLSQDQILGRTDSELFPPPTEALRLESFKHVVQTGAPCEFEERIVIHDTERVYLTIRYPIYDEFNKLCAVGSMSTDITERKMAEDKLKRTLEELQQAKDMLIQSEKLAAVGQLSVGIAHEILNPTNIIGMRLQLLSMTENLSDQGKDAINICKSQLERISRISRDMSQFSRHSPKHITLSDINAIIRYVFMLCEPQFKIESIQYQSDLQQGLPLIPIDKNRIEQVILNVVSNAITAMAGKTEKIIRVKSSLSESKETVKIEISDTGCGIEPDKIFRIFNPFFTTKTDGKGTGLGLFISYGIIKEHGGNIWAENNSTGGATFFIELPVSRSES